MALIIGCVVNNIDIQADSWVVVASRCQLNNIKTFQGKFGLYQSFDAHASCVSLPLREFVGLEL